MIKRYALALIFVALFAVLVYQPANALEAGQSLILPGKPIMETAAKPEIKTEAKVKEVKSKKQFLPAPNLLKKFLLPRPGIIK
jgi:hypothetical protein